MGQLTPEQMFDTFAINVNGPRAWDLDVAVDVTFLDTETNYRLTLRNGVLVYRKVPADESTARRDRQAREQAAAAGFRGRRRRLAGLEITGDANALPSIIAVLDRPDPGFNIVAP